jgi:hypothetical protein
MRCKSEKGRFGAVGGLVVFCGIVGGLASCSGSGTVTPSSKAVSAPAASGRAAAPAAAPVATAPGDAAPAPGGGAVAPAGDPAPGLCAGQTFCYENSDFAATVTGFRTSILGGYRIIDATVRFQNKMGKPLILGYAMGSGIAVDDKGNRYAVGGANGYRGIGYVNGQSVDPKFVVQPGSTGDARFELLWSPGTEIVGSTFELDLTVNEINTVEGNQHTLGGEFPIAFRGLVNEAPAPGKK